MILAQIAKRLLPWCPLFQVAGMQSEWGCAFAEGHPGWPMAIAALQAFFSFYGLFTTLGLQAGLYLYDIFMENSHIRQLQEKTERLTEQLQETTETLVVYENQGKFLLKSRLDAITKDLSFRDSDRITIYIHDTAGPQDDSFVNVARYSPNPSFDKQGRNIYPANEGCIKQVWEKGECFEPNILAADGKACRQEILDRYGISQAWVDKLSMNPAFLVGRRLPEKHFSKTPAIVIIESVEADRFTKEAVGAWFKEQSDSILELINNLGDNIPRPSMAKKRGF
jgi:hypothetical protein